MPVHRSMVSRVRHLLSGEPGRGHPAPTFFFWEGQGRAATLICPAGHFCSEPSEPLAAPCPLRQSRLYRSPHPPYIFLVPAFDKAPESSAATMLYPGAQLKTMGVCG